MIQSHAFRGQDGMTLHLQSMAKLSNYKLQSSSKCYLNINFVKKLNTVGIYIS